MNPEKVVAIAEKLHEVYGSEISGNRDPEWGIIRTIISQNTNSENTRRGFERLRERFPTLEDVAGAEESELAEALKPAGLHNQKAGRIRTVAQWIVERGGLEDLMTDSYEARETFECEGENRDIRCPTCRPVSRGWGWVPRATGGESGAHAAVRGIGGPCGGAAGPGGACSRPRAGRRDDESGERLGPGGLGGRAGGDAAWRDATGAGGPDSGPD